VRDGSRYSIECYNINNAYAKHLGCICQSGYKTITEAKKILDKLMPYEVENYFGVDFLSIHHKLVIYDHENCYNNRESNCFCPSCIPTFYKTENHGFATYKLGLAVFTEQDMEEFIETILTETIKHMVNSQIGEIKKNIIKF